MIRIDEAICTHCNTCFQYCNMGIIDEGPKIHEENFRFCGLCGHCAVACPSGAISLLGFEDLEIPPYVTGVPVASEAMQALLRKRRSIRHYKAEPISKEHLEEIIEAASLVPTAGNLRAFKAYVCTDRNVIRQIHEKVAQHFSRFAEALKQPVEGMPDSLREKFAHSLDRLIVNPPKGRDTLFWNAAALLLFATPTPNPVGIGDAWIASFAAVLYAETIPVGTCYNGLLVEALNGDPSIKPLLKIPIDETPVNALTLGYPDEEHFRYPPRKPIQATWI
jgi:nitroreductase/NAD-dependent dihydropyrimidine dehydrogenase PreA subunit